MAVPAFQPKQRIIYFQGAKIMQTSTMKACFQIAEVQLIFCKVRKNLRTKQVHNGS